MRPSTRLNARKCLEHAVWEKHNAGDIAGAVELTLEGYGPEVLAWLGAVIVRSELDAREIFSIWSEDVWRGLASFRWESSLRTWVYCLARHAVSRQLRASRTPHKVPISRVAGELVARGDRTETNPWQRTVVKDAFARLRDRLIPRDRMILMLRIDRRMPWEEIARVMSAPGEVLDERESRRRATMLRQRFQRIKGRLRALGREAGLIAEPSES